MDTFNKLKEIFQNILPDADIDSISENSNIKNDLGLNSIGFLYLVLAIEEAFEVEIHNLNIDEFITVKDVVTYLDSNK